MVCFNSYKIGKKRCGARINCLTDLKGKKFISKSQVQNSQGCIWWGPDPSRALRGVMLYTASASATASHCSPDPRSPNPPVSTQASENLHVNNLWPQVIHFRCQTNPFSDLCSGSLGSRHWLAFLGWLLVSTVLPGRSPWAWWVWLKGQSQVGSPPTLYLLRWILSEVFSPVPFYVARKRDFPGSKQVNY